MATGSQAEVWLETVGHTDIGRVRAENQDAWGIFRDAQGARLLVVADGMGGHRGGATASRLCVETMGRVFEASSAEPIEERLASGIREANTALRKAAEHGPDLEGMGTTVVALALTPGGEGSLAWVGDSRAYRLRAGKIEPMTRDHSLVAEWVRTGIIRPDELRAHPRRNELLRAVGSSNPPQVDIARFEVYPADRFLLCSDGLWEALSDPEIGAIASATPLQEAVARLVGTANDRGGTDNITVQIAEVRMATRSRPHPAARFARPAARHGLRNALLLGAAAAALAAALGALLRLAGCLR